MVVQDAGEMGARGKRKKAVIATARFVIGAGRSKRLVPCLNHSGPGVLKQQEKPRLERGGRLPPRTYPAI